VEPNVCQKKLKLLKHLDTIRNERTRKIPMRHECGPFRVTASKQQRVSTVLVRADSDNKRTAAIMVTKHQHTREKNGVATSCFMQSTIIVYYICM